MSPPCRVLGYRGLWTGWQRDICHRKHMQFLGNISSKAFGVSVADRPKAKRESINIPKILDEDACCYQPHQGRQSRCPWSHIRKVHNVWRTYNVTHNILLVCYISRTARVNTFVISSFFFIPFYSLPKNPSPKQIYALSSAGADNLRRCLQGAMSYYSSCLWLAESAFSAGARRSFVATLT
jgi:hypothetical protein